MSHHTETFLDDDGKWGWQCFEPSCKAESTGLADPATAEALADRHDRESSPLIRTRMDNPPAVGAPKDWRWGYLPCGCCNDGHGGHVR